MWTTTMIMEDQIDAELSRLGLTPPPDAVWSDFLMTVDVVPGTTITTGGGAHDDGLLGRAVDDAALQPTLLLTNDEALFRHARRQLFDNGATGLHSENSTSMMMNLLSCGAVPDEIVEACLTAEFQNVEKMRSGGMAAEKYYAKRKRLEDAMHHLVLRRYEDDEDDDQPTGLHN